MKYQALAVVLALILAGCASPGPARYFSTYQVEGSAMELEGPAAEAAHKAAVNSGAVTGPVHKLDQSPKLLRAPQPVMSREDTDQRVSGEVVVDILFNERGLVERVQIVRSTKTSLSECVTAAVTQWQISPATAGGKPTKLAVRQTFGFKVDW